MERDRVWNVLSELPRRQRVVLVLRYYEGIPDREIADLLGCMEGQATVDDLAAVADGGHDRLPDVAQPSAVDAQLLQPARVRLLDEGGRRRALAKEVRRSGCTARWRGLVESLNE